MKHIVIGIEGLVGSGKTSICRELLHKIPNSIVIHGGNLYRGIVYALMEANKELASNMKNLEKNLEQIDIKKMMDLLKVEIKIENSETVVYIEGKKVEEEKLQSQKSSMAVSIAGGRADNTNLFIFVRNYINDLKEKYNVILSGRALNTIYPELDYHFFITADLEERVRRKAIQYEGKVELEELKKHIETRDNLQEKAGFYKREEKTIAIDVTKCKNVQESTNKVLEQMGQLRTIGDEIVAGNK